MTGTKYTPQNPDVEKGIIAAVDFDAVDNSEYMRGIVALLATLEYAHQTDLDHTGLAEEIEQEIRRRHAIAQWEIKAEAAIRDRETAEWHIEHLTAGHSFETRDGRIGRLQDRYVGEDPETGIKHVWFRDGSTATRYVGEDPATGREH